MKFETDAVLVVLCSVVDNAVGMVGSGRDLRTGILRCHLYSRLRHRKPATPPSSVSATDDVIGVPGNGP